MRWALLMLFACPLGAAQLYRVEGAIEPEAQASVTLFGATRPFTTSVLSDESGRLGIGKLEAGTYTVAVFVPGRGEARQTIEIGAGAADARGRVRLKLRLDSEDFARGSLERRHAVSARDLAI